MRVCCCCCWRDVGQYERAKNYRTEKIQCRFIDGFFLRKITWYQKGENSNINSIDEWVNDACLGAVAVIELQRRNQKCSLRSEKNYVKREIFCLTGVGSGLNFNVDIDWCHVHLVFRATALKSK